MYMQSAILKDAQLDYATLSVYRNPSEKHSILTMENNY